VIDVNAYIFGNKTQVCLLCFPEHINNKVKLSLCTS